MTRITDKLDDRALRSVDAVLVENPWMLEYASRTAEGRSVWVRYGPPGVDTRQFCPLSDRLRDGEAPGYILSVGRLDDPRKNIGLLLEAFAVMRRLSADPPCLRLAGPVDPGPEFWQRVQALGLTESVSLCIGASRDALVDLYQHALVFALASDEEGFGIVLTEAMACGVPVVATRCGGPDGIITDGVDGYLVSRGDVVGLAERISHLVEDRAANGRMGIEASKTVEQRFSQEMAGGIFLDTYRRLLDGRSKVS
jgi:glycosyltransferase involved in cell wall biosynthesis